MDTSPHLFCFGLGYSATYLARRLLVQGWRISGTCRTPEKQAELKALGIDAHRFDRARPLADAPATLRAVTHLLSSVPPDAQGDPVIDLHRAAIDEVAP